MQIFEEILFFNNINKSRVTNSTAHFVRLPGMGHSATDAAIAAAAKWHSSNQTLQNN